MNSNLNRKHNPNLTSNARTLRKNMTKEERHLWYDFLKSLPIMVHRQKVIGRYIVDFYIAEVKLVIELDGSQHYEREGQQADCVRDCELTALGMQVLRYSNADVNQRFEGVCEDILLHISEREQKRLLLGEKLSAKLTDVGCDFALQNHIAGGNK